MEFNKKIFALLLERAKGERSLRRFSMDCDISYVQMRKLYYGEQENPPRKKLLEKLGANSQNGITTKDFEYAAGISAEKSAASVPASLANTYESLKPRHKRAVEDFALFLLSQNDAED